MSAVAGCCENGAREGGSPGRSWLSSRASIVEPAAFSRQIAAHDVLLCFSERIFSHLIDAFRLEDADNGPRFPGALKGKVGKGIAIYQGCFGGPAAGALMEALIASGVLRCLMVGQAGSVSPRCRIGDVFLPTWGVREEGTSYHYLPPDTRCEVSGALLSALRSYLEGMETVEGGVWTTDALFRETADKARRFSDQGALAVEMECTALMAVAQYRGIDFAAALVITDELFRGAWVQGFRSEEVERGHELLCRALAEGFRRNGRFVAE